MKRQSGSLLVAIFGFVLLVQPAQAKGPSEWIRISGSTMFSPVEVRDHDLIRELDIARLEDVDAQVSAPVAIRHVLHIERGYDGPDGEQIPFDEVLYAFDSEDGPGYVYYLGIVNGGGPYDGKWFRATQSGHDSLIAALGAAGINLSAYPASPAAVRADLASVNQIALLAGSAAVAGLAGWWVGCRSYARGIAAAR